MAFDFKKEYKEFYMPARKPALVSVPPMNYVAVRGKGDPNQEGSEYKRSIDLLYGIAYTIKMSKLGPPHGGLLRFCGATPGGALVDGYRSV